MSIHFKQLLILTVISFLVVQCEFLRETVGLGPTPPKAKLVGISVKKVSFQNLELEFNILVDNPNFFDIDLSKLTYDIRVAEVHLAKGVHDKKITVPSEEKLEVKLPLTVDTKNALKLVNQLWQHQKLIATWKAVAIFETPLGGVEVEFEDNKPIKL